MDISVQFVTQSCPTLCDPMDCNIPGLLSITNSQSLLKLTSIESVMQSFHPLWSPSSPTYNLSSICVFSHESVLCIKWPKYWSFSFSISPSSEYSGLISFRMDWLDLLAVQGTSPIPQESSPTPHFKSINFLALSFLYGPTLISIHDYRKKDNFGYMDLCL